LSALHELADLLGLDKRKLQATLRGIQGAFILGFGDLFIEAMGEVLVQALADGHVSWSEIRVSGGRAVGLGLAGGWLAVKNFLKSSAPAGVPASTPVTTVQVPAGEVLTVTGPARATMATPPTPAAEAKEETFELVAPRLSPCTCETLLGPSTASWRDVPSQLHTRTCPMYRGPGE
jgi:hypothetical protein